METIYTIPINESFEATMADHSRGCALCALTDTLEKREIDLILGASMMEPDVRIRTNRQGFCHRHFSMMFAARNRLGLALMLESHLAEVAEHLCARGADKGGASKYLAVLQSDCYVCGRMQAALDKIIDNTVELWAADGTFRAKLEAQPYICLDHARDLLSAGQGLRSKTAQAFSASVLSVLNRYIETLREDVSWFCKKFDYRYEEEPWYNAKDSVQRAIEYLSGTEGKGEKP